MDDMICGNPLGPRPIKVTANDDFTLLITFNNGEQRIFNAKYLFGIDVYKKLTNFEFFKLVKIEYGSIVWPDDIDYCPDCLYEESTPIDIMRPKEPSLCI